MIGVGLVCCCMKKKSPGATAETTSTHSGAMGQVPVSGAQLGVTPPPTVKKDYV